ncbi:four helix bundle protein [Joostella sp. CR20]|uniref:four helix bundle protein n=1 Tax=Joostella sp. CR20 TaxID=2804312 RepID=UPI00313C3151
MYKHSFEKLEVWNDAVDLVELIYKLTEGFPDSEKFGLVSQMKRCSISISSNLAEGTSRNSKKDKAHFSNIAFSSCMELLNQLIISFRLNFIVEKQYLEIRNQIMKVSNKVNALRKSQLNN